MISPLNIQQNNNNIKKSPLQQINPFNNSEQINRDYNSRSKSYHNGNNMAIKHCPSAMILPSSMNQNLITINNNKINFFTNQN